MRSDDGLKKEDLEQFIGTSQYFRHWTGLLYTDGISYLAEEGEAYWLLDSIGSYQRSPNVRNVELQFWELAVRENRSAVLNMRQDTGLPEIVRQKIPYNFSTGFDQALLCEQCSVFAE